MTDATLLIFRDDLRLGDHPALAAALATKRPLILAFIYEEPQAAGRPLGGAQKFWLHKSLEALSESIRARKGLLHLFKGQAETIITELAKNNYVRDVFWSRRYHPKQVAADKSLKATLEAKGLRVTSFNGSLLREPWEVKSKTGTPMKVFTPFWKAARLDFIVPTPLPQPKTLAQCVTEPLPGSYSLSALDLMPTSPDWTPSLSAAWTPGEQGAQAVLKKFLTGGFAGYAEDRNRPDRPSTSRLSPHIRFGEQSIRQIWHAAQMAHDSQTSSSSSEDLRVFQAELGWREFSYHQLFHEPDLTHINVQRRFDEFPWQRNDAYFAAWSRGKTGYPIVDAGMRELWQTGFMHNRVRMIVASFLVKHLLIDWRRGEDWFWDTLVDADVANNPASWQWVAGSGADAAPYFRIFNPMLQGEKFDPDGAYVRRFVPELARLSASAIHTPWHAKPIELEAAGVVLGKTYPHPIVDHDSARDKALSAFKALKDRA